jgi:septal ring factor EnvC (AmiA/AmiB activator)
VRKQVALAEESLQDDTAVSNLEEECRWYGEEASRLESFVGAMEKDLAYLNERRTALDHQQQYLSQHLKQMLKRERLLQAERSPSASNLPGTKSHTTLASLPTSAQRATRRFVILLLWFEVRVI